MARAYSRERKWGCLGPVGGGGRVILCPQPGARSERRVERGADSEWRGFAKLCKLYGETR
jgi:hypothetical protein